MKFFLPKIIKTDIAGYDFLAGLFSNLSTDDKQILVDFSTCYILDGNLSAVIGAVFDYLSRLSYSVFLKAPSSGVVRTTLGRNKFFEAWEISVPKFDEENFVDYKSFKHNETDAFKKYVNTQVINKQRFPKHTDLVGKYIIENIFEIFVNAFMHGESVSVNCCGEYDEIDKIFHFTIVDCGKTIKANVNEFLSSNRKNTVDDVEAIIWAFKPGNTTKKNTGGLGLSIIKEFVEKNKGSLDVVSGRGFVRISNDGEKHSLLENSFPGTIVNMNFNFNDSNNYYIEGETVSLDINDLL